jgi:anti-sigma regulatory factor (Ser/Thr protein kinase)
MREMRAPTRTGLTGVTHPGTTTGQPAGTPSPAATQPLEAAQAPRDDASLPALAVPSWARAFPGAPQQVRAARMFATSLLAGSPFCDDAVLVISELFTNAIVHTDSGKPGGLVIVQISRWLLGVRIAVTDQGSARQPAIRAARPGQHPAEHGRGLQLVTCTAEHLDWHDDASGRTVYATLGTASPDPGSPS